MADAKKRLRRFKLLEQLQSAKVESAGQRYQASIAAKEAAVTKLAGLEGYFAAEIPAPQGAVYAVNLIEVSVFKSRLKEAVVAQKTVCDQLGQQCEQARRLLMEAEQRRAGLDKARLKATRALKEEAQQLEQRRTEDAVMARYCR